MIVWELAIMSNNELSSLPEGVGLGFLDADLHVMWRGDVRNKGYIRAGEVYVAVERTVTEMPVGSQRHCWLNMVVSGWGSPTAWDLAAVGERAG